MVALGYTMVYGIINLINFAHGEVLMVGALTDWTLIGWMQEAMRFARLADLAGGDADFLRRGPLFPDFVIEKVAYRPLLRLAPNWPR